MDFNKLSLDSPMVQSNQDEDIFDENGINDDDLLREDEPAVDDVPRAQPEGQQAPMVDSFSPPSEQDFVCEYISADAYKTHGAILQFLNQNCADAASVIGCVRIPVADAPLLPAYLARNRNLVRQHAIRHLTRHLVDTQSSEGAGEKLSDNDYGMSYMLGSISKAARALQPAGRQEGPLQFCLYPHLNSPITLYVRPDGTKEKAHFINVYIHLYDINRRRRAIIERAKKVEEARIRTEEARAAASLANQVPQSSAVKRKSPNSSSTQQAHVHFEAVAVPHQQVPAHLYNYNLPRRPPAPVAVPAPPPPPVAQQPPPPPPAPEHYPPMPVGHAPINWPASPRLPDFPLV
jgi:hypothetical protein